MLSAIMFVCFKTRAINTLIMKKALTVEPGRKRVLVPRFYSKSHFPFAIHGRDHKTARNHILLNPQHWDRWNDTLLSLRRSFISFRLITVALTFTRKPSFLAKYFFFCYSVNIWRGIRRNHIVCCNVHYVIFLLADYSFFCVCCYIILSPIRVRCIGTVVVICDPSPQNESQCT